MKDEPMTNPQAKKSQAYLELDRHPPDHSREGRNTSERVRSASETRSCGERGMSRLSVADRRLRRIVVHKPDDDGDDVRRQNRLVHGAPSCARGLHRDPPRAHGPVRRGTLVPQKGQVDAEAVVEDDE